MRRGFKPGFVNYKKGALATACDKVYQLLVQGLWFSPASSTTKTGRHDITEILLKVALKHQQSIKSNQNYMQNTWMVINTSKQSKAQRLN